MKIWIDADACPKPIKDIVIKAARRCHVQTILVANQVIVIPQDPLIQFVQVPKGADVADQKIVELLSAEDIVITADIPLADQVVSQGALALSPRGQLYSKENIKQALSLRDFMTQMRDSGVATSGPKPFSNQDKHQFAAKLDRILTQRLK